MSALDVVGISKSFGSRPPRRVLNAVSLSVEAGELLAVIGPSGCGKSTLLRIIAGLEPQDAGEVRIGGRPVDGQAPKARDIAMVFQSYALYPHMTVRQNIALPLAMRQLKRMERLPFASALSRSVRAKRAAVHEAVSQAAETVDLSDLLDRKPGQLSGGQRQRVALARAIVRRPRLFLMDEPLSNLDAVLRAQTRAEIVELHQRLGITTIYVTHDQVEAMTMSTRIAVMLAGEIVQVGTPREIYEAPAILKVAELVGTPRINVLAVPANGAFGSKIAEHILSPDVSGFPRRPAWLAIRPEHVMLSAADRPPALGGVIRQVEFLGADGLVHLDLDQGSASSLIAKVGAAELAGMHKGQPIGISVSRSHLHLFDAQGRRLQDSMCGAARSIAPVELRRPTAPSTAERI